MEGDPWPLKFLVVVTIVICFGAGLLALLEGIT